MLRERNLEVTILPAKGKSGLTYPLMTQLNISSCILHQSHVENSHHADNAIFNFMSFSMHAQKLFKTSR